MPLTLPLAILMAMLFARLWEMREVYYGDIVQTQIYSDNTTEPAQKFTLVDSKSDSIWFYGSCSFSKFCMNIRAESLSLSVLAC